MGFLADEDLDVKWAANLDVRRAIKKVASMVVASVVRRDVMWEKLPADLKVVMLVSLAAALLVSMMVAYLADVMVVDWAMSLILGKNIISMKDNEKQRM